MSKITISVDYDRPDPETYRGVVVTLADGKTKRFNSGDYENTDYFNAVAFAEDRGAVVYHPSVETFETDCFVAEIV